MDAAREKEKNFVFGAERQVRNPPQTPALRLDPCGDGAVSAESVQMNSVFYAKQMEAFRGS